MSDQPQLNRIEAKVDEHSQTLDRHSQKLDEHSQKLDEHSQKLDEHSGKLDQLFAKFDKLAHEVRESRNETIRHIDMLHEYWRSEFRALREQDREILGQTKELQSWREEADIRLDVLTTSYRSLDKRVTTLEGKPGRKR